MKKYLPLILLIGLHLFLLINLRFTAWPEMLSYPFLRNNGYLLYKDMIHPYPPLLTMGLSILYKIFGYKLMVLKIVTWSIILANDILIFFITKKLTKSVKYSLLGLASYILLQPFLEGNQLWFDLAIVPPILLGTLFFLDKKYFLAGVALAIASLTKQTAGIFFVFTFLYLIFRKSKIRDLVSFLVGPIAFGLVLVLRLITENALSGFINWILIYPLTYWSKFPGYVQMALTNRQLFILVLLVVPVLLYLRKIPFLITSFFLLSFVLVYPRFSFFHFQVTLAFLVIIYGILLSKIKIRSLILYSYFLILFLLISLPVIKAEWQKEIRFWSKDEVRLSEVIKDNTKPGNLVYFQDIYSVLYVMSDRLPPRPWTDNFGWYLEAPGIQEQIIEGWDKNKPKYIFIKMGTYRPKKVMDWINKNYTKKKEIQIGVWLWEEK